MCWRAEITQTSQGSSTRSEKYWSSIAALPRVLVPIWGWVDAPKVLVWNLALGKLLLVFLLPLFFLLSNGDNDAYLFHKCILRLIEEKTWVKLSKFCFCKLSSVLLLKTPNLEKLLMLHISGRHSGWRHLFNISTNREVSSLQ